VKTHFPAVAVEVARRGSISNPDWVRPLVLVVDDEPLITDTLRIILNGNGFATLTAPDATEALEMAALMPPEVLIADLAMPGMNGLDMAVEIARMAPDCKVILFSGHANSSNWHSKRVSHGQDFMWLMKPAHPADLLECVFESLGRRGLPLGVRRSFRNSRVYDFASATDPGDEGNGSSWNLSHDRRTRRPDPLV
jgi:DNA-binding NtrC family response regulator